MNERATKALKAVHDDAMRRPWQHWVIGSALMGWAAYRIETHNHAAGDRIDHLITGVIAFVAVAVMPYVKESVIGFARGVAPFVPFARRNGDAGNSTLSGGASRKSEPK